ncbi:murein L,D-transpeptidase catalytic domain family protein [Bdellovibrio sp. HCB209]|uniref:murein L,D-transpeptidase catalytic domain family protein n=1 Tax=Bdellovibrio sp. HCB209 TaxID=3394354 RepID=UPI0039B4EEDC
MTFKNAKNVLALISVTFLMAACAKGGFESSSTVLPDDPDTEQSAGDTAQTIPPAEVETPSTGGSSGSGSSSGTLTDAQILAKYSYVDTKKTIKQSMLQNALLYYHKNLAKIKNTDVLSVIDFSLYSGKPRFHVINMKTGEVWSVRTAHGKGSDPDHDGYANSFSNVSGSNASSIGIYKTAETYSGSHGYSLRLDGLSSTNSNARARAVVVHGADYVSESNVTQGRSWGCPAVAMSLRTKLIDTIKGGSIIYASATN